MTPVAASARADTMAARTLEPRAMDDEPSDAPRPYALSARGVGVSFGGLRALDGVDLDVEPGAIIGVIGPNGAGAGDATSL